MAGPASYPRSVLPDPRFMTTEAVPPAALLPPQAGPQPPLARPRVPGDAYDAPQTLAPPPAPPSDWDLANEALAARAQDVNPYTGAKQMVKGAAVLGRAFPQDDDFLQRGGLPPLGPRPSMREAAGGTADILSGAMEVGAPFLPGAIAKAPVKMAAMLGGGTVAGAIVQEVGQQLGIPEEYVRLAVHGLGLAAGLAAGKLVDSPKLRASIATKAKQLYLEDAGAVKLPDVGGPKRELLTEPSELRQSALAKPVGSGRSEPEPAVTEDIAEVAKRLFPKNDAYAKPAGLVSSKTILKRLDAAPDLSPETRASLERVAAQIGTRRAMPEEVQALARGETYTPDRIVRRPRALAEGEKQIVGAPLGISNARQARGLRERYLGGIEKGIAGRDWYHDTGASILFHANDDPVRARLVAGDIAITSPATSVSANTGMGGKGYNQANANVELPPGAEPVKVETGRFPTAMGQRIEELHAGGEDSLGLKRDPFAQNMALGGGFHETQLSPGVALLTPRPNTALLPKTRAVHDIWDAELHGYMNPDGTPMRQGFGPAQHRFMDKQQDKIVTTANLRRIGGHTNWDDLRTQAAGWTGAKLMAGDLTPSQAALSPADYFPTHYAQGHREFTAGASTGHMPELLEDTPEARELRQIYHDVKMAHNGTFDAKGRDQITAGFGGLVGKSYEGPGYYKGRTSPGVHTNVITGSEEAGLPGERVLDEGSRRLMNAAEASHALLNFQDAYAWSRLLDAGSGGERTGWHVRLPNGTITPAELQTFMRYLKPDTNIIPIPTPGGARLAYRGAVPTGQTAFKFMQEVGPDVKQAVKAIGGKLHDASAFRSGYGENDWQVDRVGQQFFDPIRLMGTDRFDTFAPQIAANNRVIDQQFAKSVRGRVSLNPLMDRVLGTIANEGWAGLERLSKRYGIPVTALIAMLGGLPGMPVSAPSTQSVPQQGEQ